MKFHLLLPILAFVLVFQTSCKEEEPVLGCTDPEAENYNAAAEKTDNSCVYARDKFIGEFEGEIACEAPLPGLTSFVMDISEGLSGKNQVVVEFKELETPLPILEGYAKGDSIYIPKAEYQIAAIAELPDLMVPVTIEGEGLLNADGTAIGGVLRTVIKFSGDIPADCEFTATRKN